MATIDDLKKGAVIRKIVARCIADKTWRSVATSEALAWLDKNERKEGTPLVRDFVRAEYDAAGAGWNGIFQP